MSKINHIHLYRNGTVLENRDKAVTKLNEFINDSKYDDLDGVAILARYKSTSGDTTIIKTIVGFVYEGSNGTPKSITIFDNEGSNSDTDTKINSLKNEIKTQIQNTLTSANTYTNEEIAKLDVSDSPVANKFVTSVSEKDGKVEVTRASVASTGNTLLVTNTSDNGVNFDVNIDGKTIVKDDESGALSVASAALAQYVGENAVTVSTADTSNKKTVSLKINSGDNVLSQDTNGLSATLSIAYDSNERRLQLKGKAGNLISDIDATAFVKDGMLNDTAVFTASSTIQSITFSGSTHEYSGLTINHHYLAFEFKIDNDDAQPYKYEILDATSIIDVYNNGNGLDLTGHTFSVKLAQDSEDFLKVDGDGVKLSGVTDAIAAAAASAKTEVKKADNDNHINVTTSAATENGHVIYTISSVDTASASGLSKEITDRENADRKIKESVGLDAEGNHIKPTNGNYTSGATTVVGEIAALDTQVKINADKIAQNTPKGSDAITVTEAADGGSTIAVKLHKDKNGDTTTSSGLKIDDSGLAIDFETLALDCGTY